MEIKIEVTDEELKDLALRAVGTKILNDVELYQPLLKYAEDETFKIRHMVDREIKRLLQELLLNHKSEFEMVAENEARRYLANSCKYPSGTLHKAIEKVLEEYKEN